MKINKEPDTNYRHCIDKEKGNCQYMYLNKYGIETCGVDKIVQVKHYGCVPHNIPRN